MEFTRVKQILDDAITTWNNDPKNAAQADLSGHGPSFAWDTKTNLLAAVGHGKRLIQPEMIGNGQGKNTNLVVDLRTGISSPALRMPKDGPFVPDSQVQEIVDWIDAGCPD
jgi:hypothetical protein